MLLLIFFSSIFFFSFSFSPVRLHEDTFVYHLQFGCRHFIQIHEPKIEPLFCAIHLRMKIYWIIHTDTQHKLKAHHCIRYEPFLLFSAIQKMAFSTVKTAALNYRAFVVNKCQPFLLNLCACVCVHLQVCMCVCVGWLFRCFSIRMKIRLWNILLVDNHNKF